MIDDYYNSTITLKTSSSSSDSMGGYTMTWSDASTTFKGRIEQLSQNEVVYDEAKKAISTHRLWCDNSNTVAVTNRVSDGTYTYEVTDVNLYDTKQDSHHYEIGLRLIDSGKD